MKNFIKENYLFINVVIFVLFIINTFVASKSWELYYPQATIVLHDYGQIFDTIEDWKIWRIEHNI